MASDKLNSLARYSLLGVVLLHWLVIKFGTLFSDWCRGGDYIQGATYRRSSPWNPCGAQLSESINHLFCVYSQSLPIFVHEKRQSSPSMAQLD